MLIDDLKCSIEEYFDKKTENFNYYGDSQTENKVSTISNKALDKICAILDDADMEIDGVLEDFDSEAARQDEVRNIIDDMRTQDYLERSLGL